MQTSKDSITESSDNAVDRHSGLGADSCPSENITQLLQSVNAGDKDAFQSLYQLAYQQLHSIARARRRAWNGNETLNTTSLINEAFIKLAGVEQPQWQNRNHFYAVASKAMRHTLVNYAQHKQAGKRSEQGQQDYLAQMLADSSGATLDDLLQLHEALARLESERPELCQVVECRMFAGLTIDETAEALAVSAATVSRYWRLAMALLAERLGDPTRD